MATVSRKMLKSFFANGSRPTGEKFASLIDSFVHGFEDSQRLGLAEFNPANNYIKGSTVIFKKAIYLAPVNVDAGIFNPKQWQSINSQSGASKAGTNKNSDKEFQKALKLLEKRILNNLTAKVDKLIYSKPGNLTAVGAKGNMVDSEIQKKDILTRGAGAQDISVAAKGGLKAANMQSTLERLQSDIAKMAAEIERLKKPTESTRTSTPARAKKAVKPVAAKKSTKPATAKKAAKPVAAKKSTKSAAARKTAKPAATKKSGKVKQQKKSKKK